MSARFTPGPWTSDGKVTPWRNGDWPGCMVRFHDGPRGIPIANCDLASKTASQAIANARLIAAAPKMHAALAAFEKQWNACGGNSHFGGLFQSVRDAAVDALAEADADHWLNAVKARGEQVPE